MNETFCIPVDPRALAVLRAIESKGESAWFVGGCVRDAFLGRAAHDFDIATSARWERVAGIFSTRGYRVIETGAAHGSVGVVFDGLRVEVTTYRVEASYGDRRRPDSVSFVDDIALDLARRDFCMNAMAYHPERGLLDPFGGRDDIGLRVVRAVGAPSLRLEEDPLRILRALRFCAQLGFDLDAATGDALVASARSVESVAKERVFAELSELVCAPHAEGVIERYACVLDHAVEGLAELAARPLAGAAGPVSLLEHTARTVAAAPASKTLRLAALFLYMGKRPGGNEDPACAAQSARIARERLRFLKAPRNLTERVCALIARHDVETAPCRLCVRLFVASCGGDAGFAGDLLALQRAEAIACDDDARTADLASASAILDALAADKAPMSRRDIALSGSDLIAAGMKPGPAIAAMLDSLLLEVMRETVDNERDALLELAGRTVLPAECESGREAGGIFEKNLQLQLTEYRKHSNIQTRA